jgi:hypothetical protein
VVTTLVFFGDLYEVEREVRELEVDERERLLLEVQVGVLAVPRSPFAAAPAQPICRRRAV